MNGTDPDLQTCERLLAQVYLPLRDQARFLAADAVNAVNDNSETAGDCQTPERILQIFWNEQRFAGPLTTVSGQRLEVISPGVWNVEPGPDFRHACLRIDGVETAGDIEVHRVCGDWHQHGHDRDPAYGRVILHVLWDARGASTTPAAPPCLELSAFLPASWRDLVDQWQCRSYPYARQIMPGRCAVSLALSENRPVRRLFRAAGLGRFLAKTARLRQAMTDRGEGQALYEALFDALGYKNNREPMRRLAAAVPLAALEEIADPTGRQAMLYGSAGLLPDPTRQRLPPARRAAARRLWDAWWKLGGGQPQVLGWSTANVRPANRPDRRIAAGLRLLEAAGMHLETRLLRIAAAAESGAEALKELLGVLTAPQTEAAEPAADARPGRKAALRRTLGSARAYDLLVNVILPFLAAKAEQGGDRDLEKKVRGAYLLVPRLQSNRPVEEAVHRLLVPASRGAELLRHACEQQGLLQLYRDFCLTFRNDCRVCPFVGRAVVAGFE